MVTILFFSGVFLITALGVYMGGTPIEPGFCHVFDENSGPTFIQYNPNMPFDKFLWDTSHNASLCYVDGKWTSDVPVVYDIAITGSSIDLYTGNYMYPCLKNQLLPMNKTYFGFFEIPDLGSRIIDQASYLRYFAEGNLTTYEFMQNKFVSFRGEDADGMSRAFVEWYNSWEGVNQFKLYRHFYFPLDRDYPTWVNLSQLVKHSYPHPSMVPTGESWEGLCESFSFSTVDFLEGSGKISLLSVDSSIWLDNYTAEQAMFRYYDVLKDEIGFWSPNDLILNHEIVKISQLLGKKPEEVLAIFSNWLSPTGPGRTLYLNYIGTESYDWVSDPWYDISYVY